MPSVPYSPVPDVVPTAPAAPRVGISTPPQAFGIATAEAEQRLGSTAERSADQLAETALYVRGMQNDIQAKNDFVKYSGQLGDAEEGFRSKKGMDAVNGYPEFKQNATQVYQDAVANAPNPQVARILSDSLSRRVTYSIEDAGRHAGQQQFVAADKAQDDITAQALSDLQQHPDNPGIAKDALDRIRSAAETKTRLNAGSASDFNQRAERMVSEGLAIQYKAIGFNDPKTAIAMLDANQKLPDDSPYKMKGITPNGQSYAEGTREWLQRRNDVIGADADAEKIVGPISHPGVKTGDRLQIQNDTGSMGTGYSWGRQDQVKGLIIHHTGGSGDTGGVIDTLHQRDLGAQYVIDRNGTVHQLLPDYAVGRQILPGWGKGAGLNNNNTVGVEVIAENDKDVLPVQVEAAKNLSAYLGKKYGFDPATATFGHGEVNPGHKEADEGATITSAIRSGQGPRSPMTAGPDQLANAIEKAYEVGKPYGPEYTSHLVAQVKNKYNDYHQAYRLQEQGTFANLFSAVNGLGGQPPITDRNNFLNDPQLYTQYESLAETPTGQIMQQRLMAAIDSNGRKGSLEPEAQQALVDELRGLAAQAEHDPAARDRFTARVAEAYPKVDQGRRGTLSGDLARVQRAWASGSATKEADPTHLAMVMHTLGPFLLSNNIDPQVNDGKYLRFQGMVNERLERMIANGEQIPTNPAKLQELFAPLLPNVSLSSNLRAAPAPQPQFTGRTASAPGKPTLRETADGRWVQ